VTILQPDIASVWLELPEEARVALFPLLKGEDRHLALASSKEEFDAAQQAAQLAEKAAETLFWRQVKREADRLEAEQAGAADSWKPIDIADLFDTEQQDPDIGVFADGDGQERGVFYSGKVNEVHGPSESGKTMFVLAVAAQEVRAGHHVMMIDFEDDGRAIVNRLRYIFGLDRGEIEKYFHYLRPDSAFNEKALGYIQELGAITLGIIDAVTEGMSIAQLDGRNENDVATWYNNFPKKLATLGMGVVLVDHTPQENAARQIGSQHKKSAVDGVSYTAEPVYPFVRGNLGHLRLRVAKDKIGSIRSASLPQGEGKQYWRGDFKIDGRLAADTPQCDLTGVDPQQPTSGTTRAHDVNNVTLPAPSEAVILEILAETGEWMTASAIEKWHNEQLPPKDPRRISRTEPRKRAVRLIVKGLAERRESGGSVHYKITQDGLHSANLWANQSSEGVQESLSILGSRGVHEPKSEPKGEPK